MRKLRRVSVVLALVALGAAACSTGGAATPSASAPASVAPSGSAASPAAPSTDPVAGKSVRVVYAADSILLGDFVTKMAWDSLAARGLDIKYQFVAEDTLGIQAVLRGDADITGATPPSIINAHQQNPKLQNLSQYNTQGWSLASSADITKVEQLAGKRVAVHGETSFTKTVADGIIKEYDLKDVQVVIIPGSEVRAQALLSGQIDATVLDIQDVVLTQHQAPGKVNLLVSFSDLYPALTSVRWAANKDWIDANPELAREIVKAMIEADRQANDDPEGTVKKAIETYPDQDPEDVRAIVEGYIEGGHWIQNGGMSPENGLEELKFYYDGGQTKLEPTEQNVQSLYRIDILNSVLDEIGRR